MEIKNIFTFLASVLEGVIYTCVLVVVAAGGVFLCYFVILTTYRLIQLCWDTLFQHKWGF